MTLYMYMYTLQCAGSSSVFKVADVCVKYHCTFSGGISRPLLLHAWQVADGATCVEMSHCPSHSYLSRLLHQGTPSRTSTSHSVSTIATGLDE